MICNIIVAAHTFIHTCVCVSIIYRTVCTVNSFPMYWGIFIFAHMSTTKVTRSSSTNIAIILLKQDIIHVMTKYARIYVHFYGSDSVGSTL